MVARSTISTMDAGAARRAPTAPRRLRIALAALIGLLLGWSAASAYAAVAADRVAVASGADATLVMPARLRALAAEAGAVGRPGAHLEVPAPDAPIVQLGRDLFFSKALSSDGDVACVSCHHPLLGGGDDLSLSVGVAAHDSMRLGPGRQFDWRDAGQLDPHASPGPNVPRNAPTLFNVGLYERTLFHDGRLVQLAPGEFRSPDSARDAGPDLLTVQARFPLVSEDEMRGYRLLRFAGGDAVRRGLVERLRAADGDVWTARFGAAFGGECVAPDCVTLERIVAALADYQRSLVFVNTPWNRFLNGDDAALDAAERRGAALFYTPLDDGGAGCARCHSGDFLTDEAFHAAAMPQIGRGVKRPGAGWGNHIDRDGTDRGRWEVTQRPQDSNAFRTPTLLNVAVTGPYGHAGAHASLDAVLRHHLDPETGMREFDHDLQHLPQFAGTPVRYPGSRAASEAALADWRAAGGTPLHLAETAVQDLLAFLHALTDPCVLDARCLAPWMPEEGAPVPEGLHLLQPVLPTQALTANP